MNETWVRLGRNGFSKSHTRKRQMKPTILINSTLGYLLADRKTGHIVKRLNCYANEDIAYVLPHSLPETPTCTLWEVEFVTYAGEHRGKLEFSEDSNCWMRRLTPVKLLGLQPAP